jgi:hypothetical protein
MYAILNQLHRRRTIYTELLDELEEAVDFSKSIRPENFELLLAELDQSDVFVLLESIYYVAVKPIDPILTMLGDDMGTYLRRLATAYCAIKKADSEDPGQVTLLHKLHQHLEEDLKAYQDYGYKYCEVTKKQPSFQDYFAIAKAQCLYEEAEEALHLLKYDHEVTEDDELAMLVGGIDLEHYIAYREDITLKADFFLPEEYVTVNENEEVVKSGDLKITLVGDKKVTHVHNRKSETTILSLLNFLKANNCIPNQTRRKYFMDLADTGRSERMIRWIGNKADAYRLYSFLGISLKEFNDSFSFADNRPIAHSNKPGDSDTSDLMYFIEEL